MICRSYFTVREKGGNFVAFLEEKDGHTGRAYGSGSRNEKI
jgi:hypothetical protein